MREDEATLAQRVEMLETQLVETTNPKKEAVCRVSEAEENISELGQGASECEADYKRALAEAQQATQDVRGTLTKAKAGFKSTWGERRESYVSCESGMSEKGKKRVGAQS